MRRMDTKTKELTAARTELQTHLVNVTTRLYAARTAQTIKTATHGADAQIATAIERLEEQERALRGILMLICDRLGELELAGAAQ